MKISKFGLLIMAIIIISSGCTQQSKTPTQTETTPNTVIIKDFKFDPPTLNVKAGTIVTWINEESVQHQIVSDSRQFGEDPQPFPVLPGLLSDVLSNGQNYSFLFKFKGTFGYHCNLHPSMKGQIIVE